MLAGCNDKKERAYKKGAKAFIELAEAIQEGMHIEDVLEIMGGGTLKT